jgi:arylsulfatase A-like enzyme
MARILEHAQTSKRRVGRHQAPLALTLLTVLALLSCRPAQTQRPNFIFIVADTLRADSLRHAGGPRETPNIDALASESTRFANAYSTSSWTLPALASLFSAQISSQHGVIHWTAPLRPEHISFAEALKDAGYATGGFSANILVEESPGFDRGFDAFKVLIAPEEWIESGRKLFSNAPARLVNEHALTWLTELREGEPDRPFLAYLHYMEPHTPYRCVDGEEMCQFGAAILSARLLDGDWDFSPSDRHIIRRLYGSEVVELDTAIGELLTSLTAGGLLENTWIVLTADHGELLGEGNRYLHGESLERAEIRVPLLFSGPSRRNSTVATPVSLIDVAPTMLALAGVAEPPSFRGRSLVPALRGKMLRPRPVVAELFPRSDATPLHRLVVVTGNEEFSMNANGAITRRPRSKPRVRPRSASSEELARALGEVHDWVDLSDRKAVAAPEISPEMQEQLRALGYAK